MKLIDIIPKDMELDEVGSQKTDQEYFKSLSKQYPNWDYSNAEIYRNTKNEKCIKNVKCKIHNEFFPNLDTIQDGLPLTKHITRGRGCKKCGYEKLSNQRKKNPKEWIKDLSKIKKFKNTVDFSNIKIDYTNPEYPLISNFKCKIHNRFFNGARENSKGILAYQIGNKDNICPDCLSNSQHYRVAKSNDEWIEEFKKNKNNKNFDFTKTKVWTLSNNYSYAFNISCNVKDSNGKKHGMFGVEDNNEPNEGGLLTTFLKNGKYQCPKCVLDYKQKKFIDSSKIIHGDKYLYDKVDFSDPNTMSTGKRKVLIGCKDHGYFFQNTSNHLRGQGCPVCRESKGENYIHGLLKSKFDGKYKIEREKKFSETGNLEFDFFIPELKVVIEYDGEGHFWPIFGSSESSKHLSYNKIFNNDNIKNNWIKSKNKNLNGVKLIRVPYTMEFNEIDRPLLRAIKNAPPNQITYIGEYPRRHNRKEVKSQFKLSLIDTLKNI